MSYTFQNQQLTQQLMHDNLDDYVPANGSVGLKVGKPVYVQKELLVTKLKSQFEADSHLRQAFLRELRQLGASMPATASAAQSTRLHMKEIHVASQHIKIFYLMMPHQILVPEVIMMGGNPLKAGLHEIEYAGSEGVWQHRKALGWNKLTSKFIMLNGHAPDNKEDIAQAYGHMAEMVFGERRKINLLWCPPNFELGNLSFEDAQKSVAMAYMAERGAKLMDQAAIKGVGLTFGIHGYAQNLWGQMVQPHYHSVTNALSLHEALFILPENSPVKQIEDMSQLGVRLHRQGVVLSQHDKRSRDVYGQINHIARAAEKAHKLDAQETDTRHFKRLSNTAADRGFDKVGKLDKFGSFGGKTQLFLGLVGLGTFAFGSFELGASLVMGSIGTFFGAKAMPKSFKNMFRGGRLNKEEAAVNNSNHVKVNPHWNPTYDIVDLHAEFEAIQNKQMTVEGYLK